MSDAKTDGKTVSKEHDSDSDEDQTEKCDPLYHSDQDSDQEDQGINDPEMLTAYIVKRFDLYGDYTIDNKTTDWKQSSNKMVTACLFDIGHGVRNKSLIELSTANCKVFKVVPGNWKVYQTSDESSSGFIFMVHEKFVWGSVPALKERSLPDVGDSCSGDLFDKANLPKFTQSGCEGNVVTLHTGGDTGYRLHTHNTKDGSDLIILTP